MVPAYKSEWPLSSVEFFSRDEQSPSLRYRRHLLHHAWIAASVDTKTSGRSERVEYVLSDSLGAASFAVPRAIATVLRSSDGGNVGEALGGPGREGLELVAIGQLI